jgi:hypothetical protein
MANMSYCMFENTKSDLFDCVCKLSEMLGADENTLSPSEDENCKQMYRLCLEYIELYEQLTKNGILCEED